MANKVIITCAVTGAIHTPTMSDAICRSRPTRSRSRAIAAAEAGAAIIHLHARDPETGGRRRTRTCSCSSCRASSSRRDAVVNITTGGGLSMTVEERLAAPLQGEAGDVLAQHGLDEFRPLPGSRTSSRTGSTTGRSPIFGSTDDFIFRNTFRDIERILKELGEGHGTRFEFECYDIGHLYNLAHFVDRGLVKPPFFVQTIFGILGGIGADPENLLHMQAAPPTGCSATTTSGRCSPPGGTR